MTKSYATLSTVEQWQWHAEVYAFRRIVIGVDVNEYTSPCDPEGKWFDQSLVTEAERRYRNKREAKRRSTDSNNDGCLAREVENKWAQQRGYDDFENYQTVERIDHVDACVRVAKSFMAAMPLMPGKDVDGDLQRLRSELGIRAKEMTGGNE